MLRDVKTQSKAKRWVGQTLSLFLTEKTQCLKDLHSQSPQKRVAPILSLLFSPHQNKTS